MNRTFFLSEQVSKPLGIYIKSGDDTLFVHASIFYSFVIAFIIVIFSLVVKYKVSRANPLEKPRGVVWFAEYVVKNINNFTIENLGKSKLQLAPYLGMLGMYLALANLSGLLGFVAPTSDYNVTLTLAVITILLAQYYSIKDNGFGGYLKTFTKPFVFMIPNNILDLITTPLSMSMRLFGNILAGSIIMALIYNALGIVSVFLTPIFHGYFDVFAGLIQAYVFVLLTAVVIEG